MNCETHIEKKKNDIEFNTENRQKTEKAQKDEKIVSHKNWYQIHKYKNPY